MFWCVAAAASIVRSTRAAVTFTGSIEKGMMLLPLAYTATPLTRKYIASLSPSVQRAGRLPPSALGSSTMGGVVRPTGGYENG